MSIKEVKETNQKKIKEEIKDMEKEFEVEKEKDLKKELANFEEIPLLEEKDLEEKTEEVEKDLHFNEIEEIKTLEIKDCTTIKKLKCNYKIFKTERDKCKIRVTEKCEICNKEFKENDNIYVVFGGKLQETFICEDCATLKKD